MSKRDPFNIDLDATVVFSESPSRKELPSDRKKTFIERMKERENNQSGVKISPNAIQQRFQMKSSRKVKSSVDNLEVYPATKQFIKKESHREGVKYNFRTKTDQMSNSSNATKESQSNLKSPKRKCTLIDGKPVKYVQFLTQPEYDSDDKQSKPKIRKTPVAKRVPKFPNVNKVTPHNPRVKQSTETSRKKLDDDDDANRLDTSAKRVVESNVKMLFNSPDKTDLGRFLQKEFLDVCHDVELNTSPSRYSNVRITSPHQNSPLSSPRIITSNTRQVLAECYTKGTPTRYTKIWDITEGQNPKPTSIWKESNLNSSEYSNGASILPALPLPVLEIPSNLGTLDQNGTGTREHFLHSADGIGLRVFQPGEDRFDVSSDMFSEGEEIEDDQGQRVKVTYSHTLDENVRDNCNQKMEFSQAENELTERVPTNMKENIFNVATCPPIAEASDILLPDARTNCNQHGVEDSENIENMEWKTMQILPEKLNELVEISMGNIQDRRLTEGQNNDGMDLMMAQNSSAINTELPATVEVGQSRVPDLNRAGIKVSDVRKNEDRDDMMGRLFKNMDTSVQPTNDPSCDELEKLSKERSSELFSDDTCAKINKTEVNDISLDMFSGEIDDKDQLNRTLDAIQEEGEIKLNVRIVNVLDNFRSKIATSVDIDNETVSSASETATNTIEETGTEEVPLDKGMTNIEMKGTDSALQPEIPFEDSSDDLFSDIEEIGNCTHCSEKSSIAGELSQSFLNDQKLLVDSAAGSSKKPSQGENKNASDLPFEILTPELDSSIEGHEYATPYNSESEESSENAPHNDGFLCDLFSDAENGNNVESEEDGTTDDDENYKIF